MEISVSFQVHSTGSHADRRPVYISRNRYPTPVKRFDGIKIIINDLEFLAQTLDVAVDCAVINIDLVIIGSVHQRIAALDDAGPLGKSLQDQEFGHRKGHGFAVPTCLNGDPGPSSGGHAR